MTLYVRIVPAPIGPLTLVVDEDDALTQIFFSPVAEGEPLPAPLAAPEQPLRWDDARGERAAAELAEYFAGRRREFGVPLAWHGTPFQRTVWAELRKIPWGVTISYGELAQRIGSPQAARAVGRANATNPIPIIVPCHRVVGADGTLTGFAGGLAVKERLLRLEGFALPHQTMLPLDALAADRP
ncbi:MAG TPA: methylated-DNA--[protein]-cysteine S-methyltransferase [Herpetosiphonaceae bacterium]